MWLPRETALCTQTILDTQNVLVVEDASKDPRFTAIGEPEVRFYAGAPLMTSSEQAIGAVCVMDSQPRSISDAQLSALRFLAQQVSLAVEQHRKGSTSRHWAADAQAMEAGSPDKLRNRTQCARCKQLGVAAVLDRSAEIEKLVGCP